MIGNIPRILRAQDSAGGGSSPTDAEPPNPVLAVTPPPAPPPAPAREPAAPLPAAAEAVTTGPITEDSAALRKQLEEANKTLKERETEVATVQNEFHQYREAVERPKPKPKPKAPEKILAFPWLRDT